MSRNRSIVFASSVVCLAAVLGVAMLGGCKRKVAADVKEVRIGYFGNVTHAQAVLGVSSGDFEKAIAPLKLTTKVFNAGPSLIEELIAGKIDIGYVGPGPAISAHAKGPEVIRVIAGAAGNGVLIVARGDSGINRMEDLKGKRLATPQYGNTQDISARHYLKNVLKQEDLKNIRPIPNAQQLAPMKLGDIDAAWAPEPWGSRLVAEAGAKIIAEESNLKELWPGGEFNLTVVVTTPKFLAEHPDIVEKVLRVHREWTQKLQSEPQKYAGQLGEGLYKITNAKWPEDVLRKSLTYVKFTDDPKEQTLATMAEWSDELNRPKQPTKIDKLVDVTILKKLK